MKGDKVAIIFIDPGGGDHRASEITSDVFYNSFGSHLLGLEYT